MTAARSSSPDHPAALSGFFLSNRIIGGNRMLLALLDTPLDYLKVILILVLVLLFLIIVPWRPWR